MTGLPANWPPPGRVPPPRRRNSLKPVLLIVGCTFLLLAGSLYGYVSTCGNWPNSGPLQGNAFYGRCVVFSLILFLASLAWLAISFLIWLIKLVKNPDKP